MGRTGFWPVKTLSGAPWTGAVKQFSVDANAENIFVGDWVKLENDGGANVISANTDVLLGVCIGVNPVTQQDFTGTVSLDGNTSPSLSQKYSSGAGTILVAVGSDVAFESESAGTTPAAGAAANIGETTNVWIATGSTTTGCSAHAVNFTAPEIAVGAAGQIKIVDVVRRVGNTLTAANVRVLVVNNKSVFDSRQAGI